MAEAKLTKNALHHAADASTLKTATGINILAIDPGDTTGFVLGKVLPDETIQLVQYGTWGFIDDFIPTYLRLFQGPPGPTVHNIVIEDYRVYAHKAQAHIGARPYAIEVIGHVRLLAYLAPIEYPICFQSASQAKGQWPDRRLYKHYSKAALKHLGVHPRDALRHLLTFIENQVLKHPLFSKQEAI